MVTLRQLTWLGAGLVCAGLATTVKVRQSRPVGSWRGRIALITGGSRGLGLALAFESHIINVSSIGGRIGVPHLSPYCVGKFALCGLSDTLRAELEPYGIWVTTASPGLMRTGSLRQVKVRGSHEAEARWFALVGGTRLTTISAAAAASEIVSAAQSGRATVTPNWQARLGHIATVLAPDVSFSIAALITRLALPRPVPTSSPARRIAELDLTWAEPLLSRRLEETYNQR